MKNMGESAKYKERTKLREVKCPTCKINVASRMKIPRCFRCGSRINEK